MECLKRIKTLRLLGISISEIKQLNDEQLLKRICETIIQNNLPLSAVNESLLNKDNENWKIILEKIMHEDTTKENLTKKQFNQNIIIMLLWGYTINIVTAGLFGNDLLQTSGTTLFRLIPAFAIIGSICYIGVYFLLNVKAHFAFFHVSALILTPLITSVYLIFRMFLNSSGVTIGALKQIHLLVFWMIFLIYAFLSPAHACSH